MHNILDVRALDRALQVGGWIILLTVAVCIAAVVMPDTSILKLAILLIPPPLAVAAMAFGGEFFGLERRGEELGAGVGLAVVAPVVLLFLLSGRVFHFQIQDWMGWAFLAFVVMGLICIVLALFRIRGRLLFLLLMGAIGVVYAGAASILVNVALDRSPLQVFQVTVVGIEPAHRRSPARLEVSPWEAGATFGDRFDIKMKEIGRYPVGSVMCIRQHAGFLGVPWYILSECSPPYRRVWSALAQPAGPA